MEQEARFQETPRTSGLPGPLRRFADRLDEVRSADIVPMDQVGQVLVELAADEGFFGPLIAQLPFGSPGSRWLIRPERGPRLVLVHRPEAVMGYTHSHRCWVGIAPVRGVETHQKWDAIRQAGGRAELRLADERALVQGDVATLVPPRDVHNHGHVAGSGPSPYSLILLGDDMLLFDREEYDPGRGTWRALAPGNPGRDNRLPARLAAEPRGTYKIAIGLTGDPVPVGSRSGAITHRNDQRRISAHTCLSSVNCK